MTFHQVVLLWFGVAVIALAALLGWGAGSSAAAAGAPSARRVNNRSIVATRSGTSKSAPPTVVDQRIANDARLRLRDLPPGWVSQDTITQPTAAAPCPGLRRAQGWISAGSVSPVFSFAAGHALSAQNETYIYADTTLAQHWFAEFSSRSTRACLGRLLRNQLGTGVQVPGLRIGRIALRGVSIAHVGDQDAAFRVTVRVSTASMTLKVVADEVFVRAGRGLEIFSLGGLGLPFDPALETSLVSTVTGRLDADLRSAT
jgi:hypothetical protein